MNDRSLETLTRRLDRLERQVWWWKVVGSAAIGVLGFIVLIGATAQTVPGEIKASRVVIVDFLIQLIDTFGCHMRADFSEYY